MKLDKEQKQKVVLGGMIVVGVIYAYFEFLLGPVSRAESAAVKSAAALDPKIEEAKLQIAKTEALKKRAPEAQKFMKQIISTIPEGSPIVWFPQRVSEIFKKHGVEKVACRSNTDVPEKNLPGFKRLTWGLEAPKVDFLAFGAAVAALENSEPLVEIQSFEIEANRDDVGVQRAALGLHNLIRMPQ
jgi:hypothetical protein